MWVSHFCPRFICQFGANTFFFCVIVSLKHKIAKEDVDAGSDISPHTMEDEGEDEDNDSEENEAVGQENALKLGESILQT